MTEQACGEIYAEYHDKVARYVSSKVYDHRESEDIVQTVFLKIHSNIGKYDESKSSLSTWIYTITRNTVFDYLRKNMGHTEIALSENISEQSETVEECIEKREALENLAWALEKLTQSERDVIILLYYNRKSKIQAAQALEITYGQLRYLHDKAVEHLRKLLSDAI